jgi:nucleotide-binding universal stress UspA family protein
VTVPDEDVSGVDADAGAAETVVLAAGRGPRAVAAALAALAAERNAALIVLGSRGRSAWRKIMLGSVPVAVLRQAERPVLTVPSRSRSI